MEIESVMDIVSTKMTNTIATNVIKVFIIKKQDINLIAIFCIQLY